MFEMCIAKSDNSKVSAKAALVSLRTLHYSVQCCFTSTEAVGIVRDGDPSTSTSTFSQLLSSEFRNINVKCCFTSTETVRTTRDGEPRTANSTFTQLRNSVSWRAGEDYIIIIYTHP